MRTTRTREPIARALAFLASTIAVASSGCSLDVSLGAVVEDGGGTDTGTGTDSDTDSDTDTDTDTDTDADGDCVWAVHDVGTLNAVWGASASDVFAVGGLSLVETTALHYQDGDWEALDPGMGPVGLNGVWGTGPADVFIVCDMAAALRYDGAGWEVMTLFTNLFQGVWGASSDDVYAVGGNLLTPMIAHYDGTAWTEVADLPTTATLLTDVWGTSGSNVYVVGSGAILHYDGAAWSSGSLLLAGLEAIWGSGPQDIWAVGSDLLGSAAVVFHNDGGGWEETDPGAIADGVLLRGVWGGGSDDVYAVGSNGTAGAVWRNDGTGWSEVDGPFDFPLADVWVAQTKEVFAVGEGGAVTCLYE